MAVTAPAFQPYRGETGRAWMAKEYGITMDTSSIMSSGTERDDTDDEVCSFDLGPEPYDPSGQERIPSDEWLDDHQQGLQPGSSEPRPDPYDRYQVMPIQPSILDMMRSDIEKNEQDPPPSPERALTRYVGTSTTPEMNLLQYNNSQRRRYIRHHAQTRIRPVHALDRHYNYRAHGLPRHPLRHNQRSAWLCATIR